MASLFERDIYTVLTEHLSDHLTTVITGMRRVGKSTALKYLLDKVNHSNKAYFDLEKVETRYLFNQEMYGDIILGIQLEGIDLNKPAVIAIDEIQLVPNITRVIKYLYDTYSIKFLVTGSSSFYIKNRFSESLAGRKRIFEMFPLSLREFLSFKGVNILTSFDKPFSKFSQVFYNKNRPYYEEYIKYGGFPEVVTMEDQVKKEAYLSDILNAYIELDIKLLADFKVSDELYKLIRLLANRVGSKTDYTKISSLTGIHRHKIKDYLELLEYTYFIIKVRPFTKNIDREISSSEKIYFSDTGLLNQLGATDGGSIFENAIAIQLGRNGNGKINYYQKKSGQEIDFIFNDQIAIEVKQTPTPSDLKTLIHRAADIKLKGYTLIGRLQPPSKFKDFVWGGSL